MVLSRFPEADEVVAFRHAPGGASIHAPDFFRLEGEEHVSDGIITLVNAQIGWNADDQNPQGILNERRRLIAALLEQENADGEDASEEW